MEQDGAFELVVTARGALELLNELGNRLDVRGRHRASGVVHEDIEAAVRIDDPLHKGVDCLVVGLITQPLLGPLYSTRQGLGAGKARQLGPGAPHDRRAGEQQLAGDADPHAATGPGDDRDLAVERTHPTPQNNELFYYIGYFMVIVSTDQEGDTSYPPGVLGRASPSTE
jgi:hypothetical protein